MAKEYLWIVYDERAMTTDTDECAVLETCSSETEAMQKALAGVVFRYTIKRRSDTDELINETKIGPNFPLMDQWAAKL
jgi:hypothetical protein